MQKPLRYILLLMITSAIFTTGCESLRFPGVYKINVQQGNIITQEMVDQLKPGMTQRQVRFIMGNPLIQDTFNPDRWDYVYTMIPAKGEPTKERLTIFFEGDTLAYMTGDYRPGGSAEPETESP